jgi:hypothetical protein
MKTKEIEDYVDSLPGVCKEAFSSVCSSKKYAARKFAVTAAESVCESIVKNNDFASDLSFESKANSAIDILFKQNKISVDDFIVLAECAMKKKEEGFFYKFILILFGSWGLVTI